ncbi:MAG: DMT family transporter [Candidatus Eremiobacteraeota bacterium]|nr:DMT family transporter [Candidatus Eremiobacteraeota bacterium]
MTMQKDEILKYDGLLLLTALIWGFAFVGQRAAMHSMGPFAFNGIRFALGALVLIPFLHGFRQDSRGDAAPPPQKQPAPWGGVIAGLILFIAAWLQQAGLQYTTAGKAGFITGLYVVIVPLYGLCGRRKATSGSWAGAILAAVGLYLLCVTESFTISTGDALELAGAFLWAAHVMIVGWLSPGRSPALLAFTQFITCSVCSLAAACIYERTTLQAVCSAWLPLFYCGFISVGIGYTLQVIAQQKAHPAHAAVIFSLEAAWAALGGWLVLGETLSPRGMAGCAIMFAAVMVSQFLADGKMKEFHT